MSKKQTPPAAKKGLILDGIHPTDYQHLNIIYYCEQCSHFDSKQKICTIGYDASKHTFLVQQKNYFLTGKVAFCRFSEID